MKLFVDSKLSKKQIRFLMSLVALEYKVNKIYFNNQSTRVDGSYNFSTSNIFINNKQQRLTMMFVFFHELAHHVAVQQKKWLAYHAGADVNISPEMQFDIENKVDIIAKTLWIKHVDIKSWGSYKFRYPKSKKTQLSAWLANYSSQTND
jgi:Zn-dependent peptidase ImmA (M78 family)